MKRVLLAIAFCITSVSSFAGEEAKAAKEKSKTSVGLYGGLGNKDITTQSAGNTTIVTQDKGFVFGVGIGYKPFENLGFRVIGVSNSTVLGGVELDL